MTNQREQLEKLLDEIGKQTSKSLKNKELLSEFVEAVEDQPLLLWDSERIDDLALAALRVLLLDVIEDEEQEILWVQKTFAFITQSLLRAREQAFENSKLFDILKNRVVLLHSHDDFFIDILDYFFFHNTPIEKETERAERRAFVLQKVAAMQVQDLRVLEHYNQDLKNEEYLLEVEHKLLDKYNFTDKELVEAQLLSDTLFKYIWHQLSKK